MLTKRLAYLDNLKVFLTALVVFHHAGQPYRAESYWPYHPEDPSMYWPWIWHFFSTNASFFMALFFLVSGYFIPASYDRQGFGKFIRRKFLRLAIPCVVMALITSLLVGHFEIAHMWFVENLLVFSALYAVYRLFGKTVSGKVFRPTLPWLLLLAVLMGLGVSLMRNHFAQDYWARVLGFLFFEPARYLEYVVMFLVGILAYRLNSLELMDRRTGLACLIVGIALATGNYLRAGGPWDAFVDRWFGFYECLMCVSISFGLIWLFRDVLNKSGRFLQWCSAQSYGIYVFHLVLMIGLQRMTDGITMPIIPKFLLIGTISFFVAAALTWLLRLIPGMKKIL